MAGQPPVAGTSQDAPASHDTRERIFRTAAELFAEHGYSTVSMRQIAQAAGVSKPMLYYYFESKQGLLEALLDSGLDCMQEAVDSIVSGPGSIEEKLREIARMRFRYARQNPDVIKFYLDVLNEPGLTEMVSRQFERAARVLSRVTGIVVDGQKTGVLRESLDPWVVSNAILGVTGIYMRLNLRRGTPSLTDALADELFSLLMDGARLRPGKHTEESCQTPPGPPRQTGSRSPIHSQGRTHQADLPGTETPTGDDCESTCINPSCARPGAGVAAGEDDARRGTGNTPQSADA